MHNDARHFAHSKSYLGKILCDNMHPRHMADEYVVFDTSEVPEVGDDVFCIMADGSTITWRLDAMSETELTVGGYNPALQYKLPRSSVDALYPITAWGISDPSRSFDV